MKNKQKKLHKWWQKAIIIIICAIIIPIIALFTYAIIDTLKDTKKPVAPETQKTEYLDFEKSDIKSLSVNNYLWTGIHFLQTIIAQAK